MARNAPSPTGTDDHQGAGGPDVLRLVRRGRRRSWAARSTASAAHAAAGSAMAGCAHADKSTCVRTKAGRGRRGSSCLGSGGVFLGATHPL